MSYQSLCLLAWEKKRGRQAVSCSSIAQYGNSSVDKLALPAEVGVSRMRFSAEKRKPIRSARARGGKVDLEGVCLCTRVQEMASDVILSI